MGSEDRRYLGTLEVTQDVGPIALWKVNAGSWSTANPRRQVRDEPVNRSRNHGRVLLKTFPALEVIRIGMAPAFARLATHGLPP